MSEKYTDLVIILLMFTVGVLILDGYVYQVNPDGINYISIAEKYMCGDFYNAINGCWSPLFSWLLIPLLALGIPPLAASKFLSLFVALIALIGINSLSSRFDITRTFRYILLLCSIPILLYYAFIVIAPDLLLLTLLIFYLSLIFNKKHERKLWYGPACGVLGGLAYLAKAYAFPFFIIHFLIFSFIRYRMSDQKPRIIQNTVAGLVCFFLISGTWIFTLHYKYDVWTISTAGSYNHGLNAPNSKGHPMHYQGLLTPTNETAISAWEDPSYLTVEKWSAFEYPYHQIGVIQRNLKQTINILAGFSVLFLAIIFLQFRQWRLLVTLALYAGGYCLIATCPRYLWICQILLLLMGVLALSRLFSKYRLLITVKALIAVILVFSFTCFPINDLIDNYNNGRNIYSLSQRLEQLDIHGRIASDKEWHTTLYLCYHLGLPYYGESTAIKELNEHDIDYYFTWGSAERLSEYKEITGKTLGRLRVYSLK